ncbi:MAG TPA: tetratricopeptide repeat protein [Cytophagaceae bacterium]|jgi:Ca-activated chloride channel family protein|nr:tetratricopeptide repeat protein [Cytophagaceae bacterium]
MKYLVLINIFFLFWGKFNRISEMNVLKEKAAVYYQKKDFLQSITIYEKLLTEYKEVDESVKLNLANSYFQLKRYNSAIDNYKLLATSKDLYIRSTAYLQLGVIYSSNNKKELGLSYFKEALKAMPENEEARYNFELLKKEQDRTKKENSSDKKKENKNGKNKTNASDSEESKKVKGGGGNNKKSSSPENNEDEESDKENEDQNTGGEESNDLQSNDSGDRETDFLTAQRLAEMNMNERQARMILKAMKNTEGQYIQQRKKIVTSTPTPGKPDW